MDQVMQAVAILFALGMIAFIFMLDFGSVEQPEAAVARLPQPEPARPKVVEATEEATEYPNGIVVSVRKVRQWH